MLELGDQVIVNTDRSPFDHIAENTGKEYFENRGVHHTSVDLNGLHGAVQADLSKPILITDWRGAFDIITNAGTSEHVSPFEGQYQCFKNIHDCLKKAGIAVHLVPDIDELKQHGHWRNHCNFYYSHNFFVLLAELNGYTLLLSQVNNGRQCVCLRKNTDAPFTQDKETLLAAIAHREYSLMWRVAHFTRPLRQRFGLTYSDFRFKR